MRFNAILIQTIEFAREEAISLKTYYVDIDHLVLGLLRQEKSAAFELVFKTGAAIDEIRVTLASQLCTECDDGLSLWPKMMPFKRETRFAIDRAEHLAISKNLIEVGTGCLLMAIVASETNPVSGLLKEHGVSIEEIAPEWELLIKNGDR